MKAGYTDTAAQAVHCTRRTIATLERCHTALNKALVPDATIVQRSIDLLNDHRLMLERDEAVYNNLKAIQ